MSAPSIPPASQASPSRIELHLDGSFPDRDESVHAAITSVLSYSATVDINPDLEPEPSGVEELEIERDPVPSYRELRYLLFAGIPPVSFLAACEPRSPRPFCITLYRGVMTIISVIGIPAAILSFLNNQALLTGIIGIAVALCNIILFWAKEYRDQHRNWAPWLFERDCSIIILLIAWCSVQLMLCRLPALLIMSQIRSLLDDLAPSFHLAGNVENSIFILVDLILFISSYATVLLLSRGHRDWLQSLHFAPRFLIEELLIFIPRVALLLLFSGCARAADISLDLSVHRLLNDLKLAIKHAAGFSVGVILLVGIRKIGQRRSGENSSRE